MDNKAETVRGVAARKKGEENIRLRPGLAMIAGGILDAFFGFCVQG
jgi:hypothetical protein